jgi:hypothetical protein
MQWTVYTRVGVFVFFAGLVIAGQAGPMLIALGALDLAAAGWTAWALRRDNQPAVSRAAGRA